MKERNTGTSNRSIGTSRQKHQRQRNRAEKKQAGTTQQKKNTRPLEKNNKHTSHKSSRFIATAMNDLIASIMNEPYIRVDEKRIDDYVRELPDDLKVHLQGVFNWNWTYISELKREIDRSIARGLNEGEREGERDLMYRLDWWIHLFTVEPTNVRLSDELWRLVHRFRAIQMLNISEILMKIAEYNF